MLGLTSSLIKPTAEAKHRSIAFDNLANAVVQTDLTNTFLPPAGTSGDRSFSVAFWVKFNNTDANQGILHKNFYYGSQTQGNSMHYIIMLKNSQALARLVWNGVELFELAGGTIFTDAMKTSWNLWTLTVDRPTSGNATATLFINGSKLTYGAADTNATGAANLDLMSLNYFQENPLALGVAGYRSLGGAGSWVYHYLNGNISKVGFWTRVLSINDMRAMLNNPKMDWQYNSAQYSNSGLQSYFMPFSNQYDQLSTQKVFDLVTYTPPSTTPVDIFKPSVANNGWTSFFGTFTDLGGDGNETKYVFTDHGSGFGAIFITYLDAGNGGLTQNVAQGDIIKITFKYKWNGDAAIGFGPLAGTPQSSLAPTGTYLTFSVDHTIQAADGKDWLAFTQASGVAGTELFIKDMVVVGSESPADSATDTNTHYVTCTQSDQIHSDAPGN